ncbi:MAG: hypothetical protein EXS10_03695 [Phycisphaerales bacterium]|nr:hypothetical protein [Phycisphaerales bacterium]
MNAILGMLLSWFVDCCYFVGAVLFSPFWLTRMMRTGKIRTDWRARFGMGAMLPAPTMPRVVIYAVSVGETNAIRGLVATLAASVPPVEIVIAAQTDTGFRRATELYGSAHAVVRWPFDFSCSMRRFYARVNATTLILVELELWPNATAIAARRGMQVVVVNGRLSERSFRRYRAVRFLVRPMFARARLVLAQTAEYAERFVALGAARDRVRVSGTMKWDSIAMLDSVEGADALALAMGIDRSRPLVVAGSTEPGEEQLLRDALPVGTQLLIAPRKPEWFDGVARNLSPCVRRTQPQVPAQSSDSFVLDTIGELRMAYSLADVVVVGRSFGTLHGSDPIEPIGLGKATIIGPRAGDFKESMDALLEGDGIAQVSADALPAMLARLLANPQERAALAARGRAVIQSRQGATNATAEAIRVVLR